jgi:hypothetical protein
MVRACRPPAANPTRGIVQLTPPGSACSIHVGSGIVGTPPRSVQGLHLVVDDIRRVRDDLAARGAAIGEVLTYPAPGRPTVSYAALTDPDGTGWTLPEIS